MKRIDIQAQTFGLMFDVSHRLQLLMDQELAADGLTTKQWYLIVAIERSGRGALGLTEAASLAGTTRQNVKQLALKLESKGFLRIRTNPEDGRGLLLSVTDACRRYWFGRESRDGELLDRLFAPFADGLEAFHSQLLRWDQFIQEMEKE